MFRMRNFLLLSIAIFFNSATGLLANDADSLLIHKYELVISELFGSISGNSDYLEKEQINEKIINNLGEVLLIKESFKYPFDSLKNMGKITSPDMRIRIYTWNIPYTDGSHKYFGFIQYLPSEENNILLFQLNDESGILEQPEKLILSDSSWFGALYYEIIQTEYKNETYYTLLGFDFNSLLTNKKIIDVLYFTSDYIPVFGKPLFNYKNEICSRIIFEYSTKAAMGLKYNDELDMIVYDHLSPAKPIYEGNHMFYGPDFSYDGLKFENGTWNEIKDIDVRNKSY